MCQNQELGTFLFTGCKGDVATKLHAAFENEDDGFEFFMLLEDFQFVKEWVPRAIDERMPTEKCVVYQTT